MIIAAWKPKRKTVNGKKEIVYYEKMDLDELKTGWRVVYRCDECGFISHSGSASMKRAE